MTDAHDIEAQTREYYRGRALEYDEWYHRRSGYSHGAADDNAWAPELTEIEAFMAPLHDRLVFEVAAGTGWWTRRLAARIVHSSGELWMADSRQDPCSGKQGQRVPGARVQRQERELNDSRTFAIWKIYWTPADLRFLFGLVCHDVEVRQTERFFILARGIVS